MSNRPTTSTLAPRPADTTGRPHDGRTALVTGATSGLGMAAARLLAEQGASLVIVTGRTAERAEEAARSLQADTGSNVFRPLALDLSDPASIAEAATTVAENDAVVDVLILNAGMVAGKGLEHTDEGIEITMASSLTGHHRFLMALLDRDSIGETARIVISGSEAARGDLPTFTPVDLPAYADAHFGGDLQAAATSIITWDTPLKYKAGDVYATTKLFVAWWAAELADRLPPAIAVNAVSPGSAPNTAADRNMNFFMKRIMVPVTKAMPKFMGLAAPVPVAAQRYLDATTWTAAVRGEFFASAPKKMTGPLHRVVLDHVQDRTSSAAAWDALVSTTSADVPVGEPANG